jgi:hypothetical protein
MCSLLAIACIALDFWTLQSDNALVLAIGFSFALASHSALAHQISYTSQHSQCQVCLRCSAFLHKGSGTPEEKRTCAQQWREHWTGQCHDILIYWHMRWFSRSRVRGVLRLSIDSMDKATLPFPQYQWRKPKSLDRLRRPRMVVTCAWAHGFCCDFYAGHDELQPHGASAFCESPQPHHPARHGYVLPQQSSATRALGCSE